MSSEDRNLSPIVWTPERGLAEPEIRGISWNNFLLSDENYRGRWRTEAEVKVTPETALQSTVVLACCRILAETISSLPLHVYRRTGNGDKEIARDIPLYKVLSFAPNSWQTKFEFFEQVVMTLCLWGNSYTQIKSGKYGAVSELINLHPSRMDVERLENGRLRYSYTNPETGRLERYTQDQIMHIRWTPEPDGIKGMVPVEVARESIALARACEIHAAKFWANSARPGIVLQTDGSLSPEAAERLRDNWERLHRGVDRAYKTAILTNGLRVEPVGFTAEQSQFESTRRFQSEEIARVYRLPLSLVQGQSVGNIEQHGQEFVTYTLVPWLKRIESAISRSLIYNDDLFFAEFDVRGLMRGDSNSRASYYSTMTNLGIYSINDCRRLEGMAPLGPEADNHFVAMNMQTLADAAKPKPDPMAAMMGGGGAPPAVPGGVPSLPGVNKGEAPKESVKGEKSEPKPEEAIEVPQEKRALSPQNQALYDAQEEIVAKNGRWPQQGPDGAHYMEKNPFASRGISCRNCIYWEEGGSCEIVKGSIKPSAICKLWIIPEEKLSMTESRDCGTGAGGFKSGNKCAGGDGDEPVRGLRRGEGDKKQTRVARKLYQMGTSEKQIKQLVTKLGGKTGRSSAKVSGNKISISVRDSSGKDIFFVEIGYNGAGIVPIGKTLSSKESSAIESLAKDSLPEKISDRLYNRGKEYPISVFQSDAVLKTGGRVAKKGKQSRSADCGRDEGGKFGQGNDCAKDAAGGGGGDSKPSATPRKTASGDSTSSEPVSRLDLSKLLDKIAQNPDGFSLDPLSAEQPDTGIMVSEYANDSQRSIKIKASTIATSQAAEQFADWFMRNSDLLVGDDTKFVGGWKTGDDFYIDVATRFEPEDAEKALEAGRESGQLAVFNLGTFKETWVQYDKGDKRKPKEWDDGFARARKDAAVKQVYDESTPDIQDEDWSAELTKHGKKTVRSYTDDEEQRRSDANDSATIRHSDEGEGEHPRGVRGLPRVREEGGGVSGREALRWLVSGASPRTLDTPTGHSRSVWPESYEREARSLIDLPQVVASDSVGKSLASYGESDDVIYVSPSIDERAVSEAVDSGWLSQGNPILHEAGHRLHRDRSPVSYESSLGFEFTDEQRSLISAEVSRFAATSGREFVAELIAGHLAGKSYSDEVLSILGDVLS